MTIAEINVVLRLALPQGWTKEEIENHINDTLAEMTVDDNSLVEYELLHTQVNSDPFSSTDIF